MGKKGTFGRKHKISHVKLHGIVVSLLGSAVWILILAVVLLVGIVGAKYAFSFGYQVFARDNRSVESREVSVTIGNDTDALAVGKQLEKNGLIENAYVFYAQSILFNLDIKSGTYIINAQESSRSILEKFHAGSGESE